MRNLDKSQSDFVFWYRCAVAKSVGTLYLMINKVIFIMSMEITISQFLFIILTLSPSFIRLVFTSVVRFLHFFLSTWLEVRLYYSDYCKLGITIIWITYSLKVRSPSLVSCATVFFLGLVGKINIWTRRPTPSQSTFSVLLFVLLVTTVLLQGKRDNSPTVSSSFSPTSR